MKTLLCFCLVFFSINAIAHPWISTLDGFTFDPEQMRQKCSVSFEVVGGEKELFMTLEGEQCLQAGSTVEFQCPDDEGECRGVLRYETCKGRWIHPLGGACLSDEGELLPMRQISARIRVRLFEHGKYVFMTVRNMTINGQLTSEAAQLYKLKKRAE